MNDAIITSFTVSAIAICVIFLVLTILIFTIKVLVHFLPYQETPSKSLPKPLLSTPSDADEDVAVITSVMASHLSRIPGNFQVKTIQSR